MDEIDLRMQKINIVWFRRDLRLHDHAALFHALKAGLPVLPIFIFDTHILSELDADDQRVDFIHQALSNMQTQLTGSSSSMKLFHSTPLKSFESLSEEFEINALYFNHDYEPYAIQRDQEVTEFLLSKEIQVFSFKDHVIFEKNEITKDDGTPYTVYTPYSKKWKAALNNSSFDSFICESDDNKFLQVKNPFHFPSMNELGFSPRENTFPSSATPLEIISQYHLTRDYPSLDGTSKLSVHLRFGTISIRELARESFKLNEKFLNELIWRDFYQSILWHFPHVVHQAFKPTYDHIQWVNNETMFKAWCDGLTGYPIVDAGMRQLNATGWMHNRVRMIVASFLTKHLLIDWRWGEAYFAKKLIDFDLASNNGGWQWAAGCGVDAAPYFRIFNPYLQTLKFDPELKYIRQWVTEFESFEYPKPIVVHEIAREKCLEVYKVGLGS